MKTVGIKSCWNCLLALLLVLSFSVFADNKTKDKTKVHTNDITLDVMDADEEPKVNTIQLPKASEISKSLGREKNSTRHTDHEKEEREGRNEEERERESESDRPDSSFDRSSRGRSRDRERPDRDKDDD
jgi:hypothetical protein